MKYERKVQDSTKKGNFMCEECDKTFVTNNSLVRHMQIHTGRFSYYCKICRRGFNIDTNYKIHMRSHEGLKYCCQYCGKSFVNKQTHDYHTSVHTGQYRFTCGNCSKGFNIKNIFEKHQLACV